MLEQILHTEVGFYGVAGLILTVLVGIWLHAWIVKEMAKGDSDE
ncbi:MAG: hypothetical protein AB7S38_31725 [Vulcanimicrobiota bacterium]